MIEFRWLVILTLWTLLVGPVVDISQHGPTTEASRTKSAAPTKAKRAS